MMIALSELRWGSGGLLGGYLGAWQAAVEDMEVAFICSHAWVSSFATQ